MTNAGAAPPNNGKPNPIPPGVAGSPHTGPDAVPPSAGGARNTGPNAVPPSAGGAPNTGPHAVPPGAGGAPNTGSHAVPPGAGGAPNTGSRAVPPPGAGGAPNTDDSELRTFNALSSRFWDPRGEFRPLHVLNPVRADFVARRATLAGARVLDVGCGGGLLAEAMARAGARVTGIDLAPGMIEVARLHAAEQGLDIDYRMDSAEEIAASDPAGFDVVTCMEMLEHVPEPARMTATLASLARPGGSLFISTINRNLKSFLLAIVGAEYVLKLIPRGTHEYERLIRPNELARWARAAGLTLRELAGIEFNPFTERCSLSSDPSVNYLAYLTR